VCAIVFPCLIWIFDLDLRLVLRFCFCRRIRFLSTGLLRSPAEALCISRRRSVCFPAALVELSASASFHRRHVSRSEFLAARTARKRALFPVCVPLRIPRAKIRFCCQSCPYRSLFFGGASFAAHEAEARSLLDFGPGSAPIPSPDLVARSFPLVLPQARQDRLLCFAATRRFALIFSCLVFPPPAGFRFACRL
jgi:hypothetical protein